MARAVAMLVALIAAAGSSYGAYAAVRAVGPDDRTNDFGYGDAATTSPGGGDLLQSVNFTRVVTALERELGPNGTVRSLDLERSKATVMAIADGRYVYIDVDASGRSRSRVGDPATPAAVVPVKRLDPAAIDKIVKGAQEQSHAVADSLTLETNSREWNLDMVDGAEPDEFTANLDGSGLRLPDEPNPSPVGAGPDSLLRAANLKRVFAAARKAAPADARIVGVDIRPGRASFEIVTGGRQLSLTYGYDAVLTNRDLSAKSGTETGSVTWEQLDPEAPERMAATAKKLLKDVSLGGVQYVLLSLDSFNSEKPELSMYFQANHDPGYGTADLHGRKFTWPGRDNG